MSTGASGLEKFVRLTDTTKSLVASSGSGISAMLLTALKLGGLLACISIANYRVFDGQEATCGSR